MKTNKPLPHAVLDLDSRKDKANKILKIVKPYTGLKGKTVLEVGIGSGGIIHEISKHMGVSGEAIGCDVEDLRQVKEGYEFIKVADTTLPFEDSHFDLIISNHVIEHVGNWEKQIHHLLEMRRVLKKGGIIYFAVPNRWGLMEPHFKLPLLSWVPAELRTPYVRITRRGEKYDCLLLSHNDAVILFREAGLTYIQKTFDAIKVMKDVEKEIKGVQKQILRLPDIFFKMMYPVIPTMVFLLRKCKVVGDETAEC